MLFALHIPDIKSKYTIRLQRAVNKRQRSLKMMLQVTLNRTKMDASVNRAVYYILLLFLRCDNITQLKKNKKKNTNLGK